MRRMILTSLVLGMLISGSLTEVYAGDNISVIPVNNATVTFDEVTAGNKLYIKDDSGLILYSEEITTDGFYTRKFDLSQFPENTYYFEIDKDDEITILPFNIEGEKVTVNSELRTDIAKPVLTTFNDMVTLSRDATGNQNLDVYIYYDGRELVYNDNIDKDGKLTRRYDFSESLNGEYLFYIKYEDRIFMEYVNIP